MTANLPARFRKYENHASRYVVVGGKRVHYRDEGQGPTLVLLHGVMASLHTWDGWVDALKPHFRIVRIDLPGFGLSDELANDDYTPEASVERMGAVLDALGVGRCHLAGNSLGGFLGWFYAATYPERVDRMVLISPIAYPQKLPYVIDWVSKPFISSIAKRVSTPRFIVDHNVRMVYGDPAAMAPGVADRYHDLLQYGRNRVSMVKTFQALRGYNASTTIAGRVRDVKAPTLLMWGSKDRWVPPSLLDLWKKDIPGATVQVYPGAGHVAMEELPAVTAADAHRFLSAAS